MTDLKRLAAMLTNESPAMDTPPSWEPDDESEPEAITQKGKAQKRAKTTGKIYETNPDGDATVENMINLSKMLTDPKGKAITVLQRLKKTLTLWERFGIAATIGGNWQGLTVYRREFRTWNGRGYRVYAPMNPQSLTDVQKITELMSEDVAAIWGKEFPLFFTAMTDLSASVKEGIINDVMGGRYATEEALKAFNTRQSFELPDSTGAKFHPHRVDSVTIAPRLMAWLPVPEQKILMLTIGRVFNALNEGEQWRTVPLISGRPGLGKTLFMSKLIKQMNRLGYNHSTVQSPMRQFSLSLGVASSDIWVTDDCTTDDIIQLSKSSQFKSLVSGAETPIEEKFLQVRSMRARGIWVMLGNGITSSTLVGADPGVIDRIAILQCNPDESRSTDKIESDLIAETGLTSDAIWEQFLAECDYLYRQNADTMEYTIHSLRSDLLEPPVGLALAELAAIGAYLESKRQGVPDTDGSVYNVWTIAGMIDCIARGEYQIPVKLNKALTEINWERSVSAMQFVLTRGGSINPANIGQYISTKSGHTMPKQLGPYRRVWEQSHARIVDLRKLTDSYLAR